MKILRVIVLMVSTAVGSLLLFLVLLDVVLMPYLVDVDHVRVPDIRNRGMAEVAAHMKRIGLRITQTDSVFHERLAPGTIVEQTPAPPEYIKKGRRVFVQLSKGQRLYQVPVLIGVGERDARLQLQTHKLRIGQIYHVSSTSVPLGAVIRQQPSAGSRLRGGESVDLEISSGSPLDPKPVPNVLGLDISVVEDSLSKYEMTLDPNINERFDPTSPPGKVLSQDPPPGALRMWREAVKVVVSVGRSSE